jgi:asparagine synthase (glutamine-hydrolysing)
MWFEPRLGVAVAHRRLAILDRTSAAAQPFVSASGRWVLAYNGELWNFRELRRDLEAAGHPVGPSTGDTAVLAAMLDAHGVEATLPLLDGMFAFAAVDLHERSFWLARDRFGVKPCFWGHADDGHGAPVFVFGSELRALAACPVFRNRVSPFAIASVLGSLATRGERTIWEGMHALRPGHALRLELSSGRVSHREWFSARAAAASARQQGFHGDRAEMVRAFDGLLESAVRRRLPSDVPLGAFLSGGIDSSLVVAAMRHAGVAPLRTFTVGFEHVQYDERAHARAVAKALGTDHHEVMVPDSDLVSLVEDAIGCFDAPFADSSAVATLAVSRAARSSVGVVLSGEGGAEDDLGFERIFTKRPGEAINDPRHKRDRHPRHVQVLRVNRAQQTRATQVQNRQPCSAPALARSESVEREVTRENTGVAYDQHTEMLEREDAKLASGQ